MQDGELSNRYTVVAKDGKPTTPGRRYFVLSPDTDPAAMSALAAYADAVENTHPILAGSIRRVYGLGDSTPPTCEMITRPNPLGVGIDVGWRIGGRDSWWGNTRDAASLRDLIDNARQVGRSFSLSADTEAIIGK